MKDSDSVGELICKRLTQEVSEEKNFNMWPRDCSCDILVKNVSAFYHLKSQSEDKVKRFRLSALTKEISTYPSIDSACESLI